MAATRPDFAAAGVPASARRTALPVRATHAALAAVSAGAGLGIASAYPIAPAVALAVFVGWVVFAVLRTSFALPALLALLPVIGFAPWTGWLTFEELDLLILATAAGGHAALALHARVADDGDRRYRATLSIFSLVLIALFTLSLTLSLGRGVAAAGGWRFDLFQGYDDPLNSLRIYKSFVWAVLLAPLLTVELRRSGGFDRLGLGLTAGLGLCALAVLRERYAFTGLLGFSDDYRVTSPFWEMHVGGAALDGFLALTIPFAVREAVRGAMRGTDPARFGGALLVLAMAAYACLVTFSRGVYLAIPIALLVLVVLLLRQRARVERKALWGLFGGGLAFTAAVAIGTFVVFRAGGYRAVIATLAVLAATIVVEPVLRRSRPSAIVGAAAAGFAAAAIGHALGVVLPKGPYVVFGVATIVTVAAIAADLRRPTRASAGFTLAAWSWLALAGVDVAHHWGGTRALVDAAAVLGTLLALAIAASRLRAPVWPQRRAVQWATIGYATLVMGAVAVFTAGAYMGGRFSSSRADFSLRTDHWLQGINRLHTADEWLLGKGLGRFPATSQFESPNAEAPGAYRLTQRNGERFVAIAGPRLKYLGFGELFRFSQRVSVRPGTRYLGTMRVRSAVLAGVHLEVCEKQLLYNGTCAEAGVSVPAGLDGWHTLPFELNTAAVGSSGTLARRPVWFAIATGTAGAVIELRSVQLIGPDGVDVVANGSFSDRTAYWFSSSDKYHLPWHIKNIALDVLFDQGVFGLVLFAVLVAAAFVRTAFGRAHRHPDAPYVAAALTGFIVVGAFDSLLDVPRVAFAFYVVVLLGLMLRNPRAGATTPRRSVAAVPMPAPPIDEAEARRLRRQQAFGRRGPVGP